MEFNTTEIPTSLTFNSILILQNVQLHYDESILQRVYNVQHSEMHHLYI